jgi:predicted RNase H-like nuclease (RuvC/YqgF family)
MIETFETYASSLWTWFVENKDTITAFFMSSQFVSFLAACIALIKSVKQTSANTESTNTLNETLTKTNEMSTDVKTNNINVTKLTEENANLRTELKSTEEKLTYENEQLMEKLNAIIEVQSIVYSTIRDDSVRQTVNTILNNARYSDVNTREKLQSQIDDLKKTFDDKIANVVNTVDSAMDTLSDGLNLAETAKKKAMELKGIEDSTTRY